MYRPITRPTGFQEVEATRFRDSRHKKVVRLSVLRTGHVYGPRKYFWYSFLLEAESIQGRNAVGRIVSLKNSRHTIGKRTHDLPACSAVTFDMACLKIYEMEN